MAEQTTRTEILNIQVNYRDALDGIARYNREIELIQANQAKLRDELRSGAISQSEYGRAMAASRVEVQQARESIRLYEREIRNGIKAQTANEGSITSLRAQVRSLRSEYDAMSKAQRESAQGQGLLSNLNNITDELNGALEASQRFQQNVGNYPDAFINAAAGGNQFAQSLLRTATAGQGVTPVIKGVGTQISAMGKAILANPIGAAIAAIVVVIMLFKNAVDSSERSLGNFTKVTAFLQTPLKILMSILQFTVAILLEAVDVVLDFVVAWLRLAESLPFVGGLLKDVNDELERSIELERDKQALLQQTRAINIQNAQSQLQVSQLRANAENRELYTAEQRLAFIQQANKLEQQIADNAVAIAQERLRIRREELRFTQGTTQELDELAQLQIEVYNAERNRFERTRELIGREQSLRNDVENAEKKRREDAAKAGQEALRQYEEQLRRQTEIRRAYEDSITKLIADEGERARAELNNSYNRQIQDLERRLSTEKNLTVQARQELNATLLNLQIQYANALEELENSLENDELNKEADRIRQNLENQNAVLKANSEEALQNRLDLLQLEREATIRNAEQTGADVALINARYDKEANDLRLQSQKATNDALIAQTQAYYQRRTLEAQLNHESTIAVEIERRQTELAALQQLEDESDAMFLERKMTLEAQLALLQQERAEEVRGGYSALVSAAGEMFGAFSDFLGEFSDQNEAFAVFSKALALFQIVLATGEAISKGIAAAQSVPFPGNLAAIATTIAAITANIAQATQIVKKAKEPKANGTSSRETNTQYFSEGGYVRGAGSGTSDSVPAMLSNGESVLTARATEMFSPMLSAFNQIGGGVPISTQNNSSQVFGEAMLTRAFAKALESMPNPQVAVTEIERVARNIQVLELDSRT